MLSDDEINHLERVIDFWFNHLTPEDWFTQSHKVDQEIITLFSEPYNHFKVRALDQIDLSGDPILAAIILFDQMPRNMFRNSAQSFATDDLALSLCKTALAAGHDLSMTDIQKSFIYMPLEHSENLKDQELCISLFQQRTDLALQVDYAIQHCDIIQKFGRFPHRNIILGRTSTPDETDYLANGGETFSTSKGSENHD